MRLPRRRVLQMSNGTRTDPDILSTLPEKADMKQWRRWDQRPTRWADGPSHPV